jgi:hypothetical protein
MSMMGAMRLICVLLVVCSIARAQDQNADQPNSETSQQQPQTPQNSSAQSQTSPEQSSQETSSQSQPSQNQASQDQSQQPDKKDASSSSIQEQKKDSPLAELGQETLDKVRDWEIGWFTGPYISRNHKRVALTAKQRQDIYLEETFTTSSAYFKRAFAAAIDQARDSPSQWPEGWGGYGERFASREGQFFAADSLAALGDAMLKYEPRYDQCRCHGFWPRTRHAILRNFLTYDDSEQHLHPQWALYGGAFAGGVIAASWKPHLHSVFIEGGIAAIEQAAYGSAFNLWIEFSAEINRKLWKRK